MTRQKIVVLAVAVLIGAGVVACGQTVCEDPVLGASPVVCGAR